MEIDLNDHDWLWFPGLAERLVSRHEATPTGSGDHQRCGFDESNEERSDSSPQTPGSWQLGQRSIPVEDPPSETALRLSDLNFASIDPGRSCDQLQKAADVLGTVDGLVDTLGLLVRVVHILEAPIGYDVSHSDPELPFTIFVSLPQAGETDSVPRLAEAMLHESMHLQLSMIEHRVPLIAHDLECAYSPWKHEVRPVSGLLHGLYVFAVIHQVCERWGGSQDEWIRYGQRRRAEIEEEVTTLPERPGGLCPIGSELWHRCRRSVIGSSQ
jgi:HEXXH motif-containing protein